MKETLYETLKKYNTTMLPMHMPGHKRNSSLSGEGGYLEALCAECDITEVEGFDNLAEPEGILHLLKERIAKLWNSEDAYPLVNGSTCGILAGIYAAVPRGGKVILARNCHKSVYNGLQMVNASCVFLQPEQDCYTGIYGCLTPEAVEEALTRTSDADLIIVTSPTYEGIISDVEGICKVAHKHGVPVLVDSAHGAHLGFGNFPKGAAQSGADLVVHSLHKTLPCLTQTAVLHRNGTMISREDVQAAVNVFQTSSPSYLLLASIDGCVGLLEEQGEELACVWEQHLKLFYDRMKELRNLSVDFGDVLGCPARDSGKIVIRTVGTGLTGTKLTELLRNEYRIELEMAAEQYAIAMTGMGDTEVSLHRLADALLEIDENCPAGQPKKLGVQRAPVMRMTIADAVRAEKKECVLEDAIGYIAAEHVWAYPPGIPVVVAGEVITEEIVAYVKSKKEQEVTLHRKDGVCKERLWLSVIV